MHHTFVRDNDRPQRIAVLGTGISGMAAAWLLGERHQVTVYEKASRIGGHSNTVNVESAGGQIAVDTGFIVYNEHCYPNLTAMFRHFDVQTRETDMSLSVSLDDGALEYAGNDLNSLFAQRRNLLSPRFWLMLRDLVRFYREAPAQLGKFNGVSIGDWLDARSFGQAFRDDHLMPMAASIWSAPAARLLDYPAEAFVQFCENHGLLKLSNRPLWRTVSGGSIEYVKKLTAGFNKHIRVRPEAVSLSRLAPTAAGSSAIGSSNRGERSDAGSIAVRSARGDVEHYDAVVIATHADEALALLDDPSSEESALLGAFRYSQNRALLHGDTSLMPQRRKVWSSWNYVGRRPSAALSLTYWMNRLQHIDPTVPLFVTLNPERAPAQELLHYETEYTHPIFNLGTLAAQQRLWHLQGQRNTWFCGSYFGAGFHEDGLQAGLAVAEQLGGLQRPWQLVNPSTRIHLAPTADTSASTSPILPTPLSPAGVVS
jgi:predicted NAD/FAD-binding protein